MSQPAIAPDAVAAVIRGRRSIDLFAPDRVDPEVLRAAIDVARWAPNHRLTEPWRFYLLGPVAMGAVVDLVVKLSEPDLSLVTDRLP